MLHPEWITSMCSEKPKTLQILSSSGRFKTWTLKVTLRTSLEGRVYVINGCRLRPRTVMGYLMLCEFPFQIEVKVACLVVS